jgi:two-component system OmpR family sensor kinase/two-component system sensor histidine kinase BaeS
MVGILVGVISSRGLAAPLHNLAEAAKAVGSQDLSQRIEVKGTEEVREVAIAFNAMAEALEEAEGLRNNMLADIAHELRTPLTVIQGNLRAILDSWRQNNFRLTLMI